MTATKLRPWMDKNEWTAQSLAVRAGVSVATIHALCLGTRKPSWKMVRKLGKALKQTDQQVFALCEPQE
jgi:DNA-binding XRE family transcriptional regulator